MSVRILIGDVRDQLKTLPDESVHCVVTSPPYWGLRDYGTASWEGGDPACDHSTPRSRGDDIKTGDKQGTSAGSRPNTQRECKCGATRTDKQIGLEPTPAEFVAVMVEVFREVRRVLRKDGTLWLNLGDSYASGEVGRHDSVEANNGRDWNGTRKGTVRQQQRLSTGLPHKNLLGIPWRVAFALQADGWVLRQEIIWQKPNPMPESVTDRCTKAHEQIFLFAKAEWSGPAPGRFAEISDEDARWLALSIDTEGCIVVKRTKQNDGGADTFAPQVSFGSTNRALMERFREIVGHGNLAEREGQNAPMIYWQAGNNIAADFLRRIYPHMIVKQRQARIGIHVDSLTYYRGGKKPEKKQRTNAENDVLLSLWARGKECNHFGSPDLADVPEPIFGRWASCARYHYDADAISEPAINAGRTVEYDGTQKNCETADDPRFATRITSDRTVGDTRNRRSVWTVATQPFKEAHFATFPPDLIEPCIKAGCPKDCCAKCGAPVVREIETTYGKSPAHGDGSSAAGKRGGGEMVASGGLASWSEGKPRVRRIDTTACWSPSCSCFGHWEERDGPADWISEETGKRKKVRVYVPDEGSPPPVPGVTLDPFGGAGTTGLVADRLQRDAILIELNPEYAAMMRERIEGDGPLFAEVAE